MKKLSIITLILASLLVNWIYPAHAAGQAFSNNSFENGGTYATYWNGYSYRTFVDDDAHHGSHIIQNVPNGQYFYQSSLSVDSDEANYISIWFREGDMRIKVEYNTGDPTYETCNKDHDDSEWRLCIEYAFTAGRTIIKVTFESFEKYNSVDFDYALFIWGYV